jgi:hypothetical protein
VLLSAHAEQPASDWQCLVNAKIDLKEHENVQFDKSSFKNFAGRRNSLIVLPPGLIPVLRELTQPDPP